MVCLALNSLFLGTRTGGSTEGEEKRDGEREREREGNIQWNVLINMFFSFERQTDICLGSLFEVLDHTCATSQSA